MDEWRASDRSFHRSTPWGLERWNDRIGIPLDAADGLEAGAGVDFGLRQHRGLGAEPLDHPAHERADAGRATSTGASPACAASSKRCRTSVMNSVSLEGCMA